MYSVVIPVYNESASLETLYEELRDVSRENGLEVEFIFVDDGCTDGSWQTITDLASVDDRIRGIRLRRNFGKAAALAAGFRCVRGSIVFTMDADLQDDPREIPGFLEMMEQGYDVISGWKKVRHDAWHKVAFSRIFNWLVSRLTGVRLHDHNCGLKCYRSTVVQEVKVYGELHRFIPVLAAARGFRVGERVVQHRARRFGHSKYGAERVLKGLLDLFTVKFLTGFGQRPLHLLGGFGLVCFCLGAVCLTYLAGLWCVSRMVESMEAVKLHQRALLYYALGLLVMGGQLLSIGVLGELILAFLGRDADFYSVAETTFTSSAYVEEARPDRWNA